MGLADRSKALRVGDQIVTINEKSVEGLPHKGVERMISTPAYTITLGKQYNRAQSSKGRVYRLNPQFS